MTFAEIQRDPQAMHSNLTTAFCKCTFLIPAVLLAFSCSAEAQGLRVSTVVYNAGQLDSNGAEAIVSSSVCLFHAGKAYDYVESVGEVVVYEPSENRFVLMNARRGHFTTIRFEELNRLLAARAPQVEKYLDELRKAGAPDVAKAERSIRFQLDPKFRRIYDAESQTLVMKGPSWTYVVSTREWNDEDQLQKYIQYTDWTARLNYVLHPSSLFPEPRLALNRAVTELKTKIPVVVQLSLQPDEKLTLRAEHQYTRGLSDQERRLINDWTTALKSDQMKEIPFRQYQEKSLAASR